MAKHPNLSKDLSRNVSDSIERAMTFKIVSTAAQLDRLQRQLGYFVLMFDVWAVAAILYEEYHAPFISDHMFDELSNYIRLHYDEEIKKDYPKELKLFSKEQFEAGTGMGVAAILANHVHARIAKNIVGLQGTT
jgi:hypothetical protein